MSGRHPDHEHPEHARHGHADDAEKQHAKHPEAAEQGAVSEGTAEIDKLSAELEAKEKELAEFKDKYLRALADFENSRKRLRQQSEDSIRIQKENLLRELLPMVDNLERALEAAKSAGGSDAIVQGVDMVARAMLDFLRTHGVTQVNSVGEQFDPARHEAIAQI